MALSERDRRALILGGALGNYLGPTAVADLCARCWSSNDRGIAQGVSCRRSSPLDDPRATRTVSRPTVSLRATARTVPAADRLVGGGRWAWARCHAVRTGTPD